MVPANNDFETPVDRGSFDAPGLGPGKSPPSACPGSMPRASGGSTVLQGSAGSQGGRARMREAVP